MGPINPNQNQYDDTNGYFDNNQNSPPLSQPQTDPIGSQINRQHQQFSTNPILDQLSYGAISPGAQQQYIQQQMDKVFGTGKKGMAAQLLLGLLGNVPAQMRDRYAQEYKLYQEGIKNAIDAQQVKSQMQMAQERMQQSASIADMNRQEKARESDQKNALGQLAYNLNLQKFDNTKLNDQSKRALSSLMQTYQGMKNQQYQMTGGFGSTPFGFSNFLATLDENTREKIENSYEWYNYAKSEFSNLAKPGYETKRTVDFDGNSTIVKTPIQQTNTPSPPNTGGSPIAPMFGQPPQNNMSGPPSQPGPTQGGQPQGQGQPSQQPPPSPTPAQQNQQTPLGAFDTNKLNAGRMPPIGTMDKTVDENNPQFSPPNNIGYDNPDLTPGISPGAISPVKTRGQDFVDTLKAKAQGQPAPTKNNSALDPDVEKELSGEYGVKSKEDFKKQYGNTKLGGDLYKSYIQKQIPTVQVQAKAQLKLGALDNTLQLASDFYNLLPQLNSVSERAKLALINEMKGPQHPVSFIINSFLSQGLNPKEVEILGKYASLAEHINTLREPLGATGFRSIESYNNLIRQAGDLIRNPKITETTLENTLQALLTQRKVQAKLGSGNLNSPLILNPTATNSKLIARSYLQASHGDKTKAAARMREDGYK